MAQTFNCPSCGAPLEPQGDKATIICKYCNESVIVPEELRTHSQPVNNPVYEPIKVFKVTTTAENEERARNARAMAEAYQREQAQRSRNSTRGWLWFVVIIVVVSFVLPLILGGIPMLIGLVAAFNAVTGANVDTSAVSDQANTIIKPDVRVMDPVIFASTNGDTLTPDFLAPINDNPSDAYQYAMVSGQKRTILWRSQDLGKSWSEDRAFVLDKQVIVFNQTTMSAIDRQSGKKLWDVSLNNGLGYCKTCLLQYGSSLVAILKDGTVQAVDAASGKLTWSKTLESTNADLFDAAGKPGIMDNSGQKAIFYIFDPVTGKSPQIQPACSTKAPKAIFDEYEIMPDGKSLLLLYDGCMQTVSLPDWKVISEIQTPEFDPQTAWPDAWFATKRLVTADAIYYTDNGSDNPINVTHITQADARQLIVDKKYDLLPKLVVGNVLVVEAVPSFDSNQHEYWGVDTSTGQRLWQYGLKGQGTLRYFDVHVSSAGVFVVQCRESPGTCVWANINPKTGVASNAGTGLGGTFFDPSFYKNTLYLVSDGTLAVIDTMTGKQLYQWP